jgi:hypothetical protein
VWENDLFSMTERMCVYTQSTEWRKKASSSSDEKERKERPKKNKKKSMQAFLNKKE